MSGPPVSPARRREVIDALRRGTVPQAGLDLFAVGLDRFEQAIDDELATVAGGGAVFKAVRGEYGSGKTFFTRWLAERAKRRGFAVTEIQISETETPLHRLETVYRRLTERLATVLPPAQRAARRRRRLVLHAGGRRARRRRRRPGRRGRARGNAPAT